MNGKQEAAKKIIKNDYPHVLERFKNELANNPDSKRTISVILDANNFPDDAAKVINHDSIEIIELPIQVFKDD